MKRIVRVALIASLVLASMGCGDEPDEDDSSNNSTPTSDQVDVDTSDFDGVVGWTSVNLGNVVGLRDLGSNDTLFQKTPDDEDAGDHQYASITVSADESTAAYSLEGGQVVVRNLGSGEEMVVPKEFSDSEDTRVSTSPSLSADASQLVYTEFHGTTTGPQGIVGHISDGNIAMWNMTGDPTLLTDSADNDALPVLSDDASQVTFVSERSGDWDFYQMPVDASSEPERLTWNNHPDITGGPDFEGWFDNWSVSADGALLAFRAAVADDGHGAFLMDTQTGDIRRLGELAAVQHIDISSDGSTVGVVDCQPTNLQGPETVQAFDTATNEATVVWRPSPDSFAVFLRNVAVNADGTAIVFTKSGGGDDPRAAFPGDALIVVNADGSNPTLVATSLNGNYTGGLSFSHVVFE